MLVSFVYLIAYL